MAWEQLTSMITEAADIDQEERSGRPTSCINDGTPLREGPDGTLYCPYDGLVWPDDASAWGEFPGGY